jgi:penicillin-binding protein 1C
MQLIRLSCLRERSLTSRSIEAFRALPMERQLNEQEIILLYLNRTPFGANLVGVESLLRLVTGVLIEISETWETGKTYLIPN